MTTSACTTMPTVSESSPTSATSLLAHTTETPVGPLSVVVHDGAVVAAGFTSPAALHDRLEPSLRGSLVPTDDIGPIGGAIAAYLDGDIDALDQIPVAQPGTTLQQEVWAGLRSIPAGQTRTYTQLAAMTSNPRAVRAAGTACGRNLIAPMVPCHRALRTDGSLGGYYYGLDVKRWLLDHESTSPSR